MQDLSLIKQLLPFLPVDTILYPPKPAITQIPYRIGIEPIKYISEKKVFLQYGILEKVVLNLSVDRSRQLTDLFNDILPVYGLDVPGIFHEFIAQIAHETGGFRHYEENLNYSWQGLRKTFKKYFLSDGIAKRYHRKPASIGSRVYANRMGNGTESSGDGWQYRGGGAIQLTGKVIWTGYAAYKRKSLDDTIQLVRSSETIAIDSACWYFCIYKSLKTLAERDQFEAICRAVNGGLNGYQDRLHYYSLAKQWIV